MAILSMPRLYGILSAGLLPFPVPMLKHIHKLSVDFYVFLPFFLRKNMVYF